MKQIYRFDCVRPPVLSEKMLQAEIERRKIQKQTVLLALAGILADWCLVVAAVILQPVSVFLSFACISYACIAVCGSVVIAIVFSQKRRTLICSSTQSYPYSSV